MSMGRGPKSSPPGNATRAWPKRASSGPRTTIDARIRSTSSYGATGSTSAGRTTVRASPSWSTVRPIERSRSAMAATSSSAGTLRSTKVPSARTVAAISLSTEFLAPLTRTRPSSGPLGRTTIRCIRPSVCSLPPFPLPGDPSPIVATVVNSAVLDRSGLEALLGPRDDVVTERPVGATPTVADVERGPVEARYEAALGPLETYGRVLEARARADGRFDVTETTRFRLAIPLGGVLFAPGYRHELRRMTRRDRPRHPFWAPPDRVDARAARILG